MPPKRSILRSGRASSGFAAWVSASCSAPTCCRCIAHDRESATSSRGTSHFPPSRRPLLVRHGNPRAISNSTRLYQAGRDNFLCTLKLVVTTFSRVPQFMVTCTPEFAVDLREYVGGRGGSCAYAAAAVL